MVGEVTEVKRAELSWSGGLELQKCPVPRFGLELQKCPVPRFGLELQKCPVPGLVWGRVHVVRVYGHSPRPK